MPRVCTICTAERRHEIDVALVNGVSVDELSRRYPPLSATAIRRHRDGHLPKLVQQAQEATEIDHGLDVLGQLRAINSTTMQILSEARQQKNPDVALKAVDRIQRQIELQAKLLGELDERPIVNIVLSPQWIAIRAVIVDTLADYPAAKVAVAARLMALEAGQ